MTKQDKIIQFIKYSAIIVAALLLLYFATGGKGVGVLKSRNPYGEVDDEQLGEIQDVEDDDFDGVGDTDGKQAIDSNRVTYFRQNIPVLKSSMLIPQGWEIKEMGPNIFIRPPEGSELEKVQVSMYMEATPKKRDPNNLVEYFDDYMKDGFVYKNGSYNLAPHSYNSSNAETLYNTNKKAYIHKSRKGEFEQLPEIPEGLNPDDFIEQNRFVGIINEDEVSLKDLGGSNLNGKAVMKSFYTLTGNNKALLINYIAPKNFKDQMDEVARVMSLSVHDEFISPGDTSDAKPVKNPKSFSGFNFRVPEGFRDEKLGASFYEAKAYKDIFDKAYGINVLLKTADEQINTPEFAGHDLSNDYMQDLITNEIKNMLYDDSRGVVVEGYEDIFDNIINSHKKVSYGGAEGVEYVFTVVPNGNPSYSISNLRQNAPTNVIATLVNFKEKTFISMITYDSSNYELARVYNDSILKSLSVGRVK